MTESGSILFVVTQHGSFNVVYPVLKACAGKYRIGYWGLKDIEEKALASKKILTDNMEVDFSGLDEFDLFVTGTSPAGEIETRIWEHANVLKKNSVAILDAAKECRERFIKKGRSSFPCIVCVPDGRGVKALADLGMGGERVIITGSPYLENTADGKLSASEIQALRSRLSLHGRKVVTFCTEYIASAHEREKYGYDELMILDDIIAYAGSCDRTDFKLLIRLHPKDSGNVYDKYINGIAQLDCGLITEDRGNKMLQVSDVVIGMSSVILVEAAILGLDIVSYQPVSGEHQAQRPHDIIERNLIVSRDGLYERLNLLLSKERSHLPAEAIYDAPKGSVGKIMGVLERILLPGN